LSRIALGPQARVRVAGVEIVLALGSALTYGISDFTGGILAKRAHVLTVVLLSQLVSCAILTLVLPFWDGTLSWGALQFGAAAGVAGMAGASLLYRGLAIGRMGVVAPITAVLAAAIPVAFGLATGERPGAFALIGVVTGLAAVVLISSAPEPNLDTSGVRHQLKSIMRSGNGVPEALGAGAGFGLFFILLERAPADSGLWPLAGTRISMVVFGAVLVAVAGAPIRPPDQMGLSIVWLGFINLAADLLYLLATRSGLLSLVAVITSLYPAATVGLARIVLNERMVKQQMVGVGCAAVSVVLIAGS
jgi:drug/metabolite transporter (DMT)-like permease